ncbi:MAG: response regulator transcription factor [Desulfobulbus sp.]|nr:response regulator transcription factor [Desulfobulbus sp.]
MKILVVESNITSAMLLKNVLENEGCKVDVAHGGERGFRNAFLMQYELVIVDLGLRKEDGITLIKEMREEQNCTPVVILTRMDFVDDIVAGLDAGDDDYVTKPINFNELLARIKVLQRRTEYRRREQIFFADLFLDSGTKEVWRNQKLIKLTNKEFKLLEFFMQNTNQILTRKMITSAVWQEDIYEITNKIAVCIFDLRKKIDSGFEKKLIHTVKGFGYIMKDVG